MCVYVIQRRLLTLYFFSYFPCFFSPPSFFFKLRTDCEAINEFNQYWWERCGKRSRMKSQPCICSFFFQFFFFFIRALIPTSQLSLLKLIVERHSIISSGQTKCNFLRYERRNAIKLFYMTFFSTIVFFLSFFSYFLFFVCGIIYK